MAQRRWWERLARAKSARGVRAAGAAALIAFAVSCSLYDPSLAETGGGGLGDIPRPPPPETSSPDDDQTIVFAMRDLVLDQSTEENPSLWRTIGLDLDQVNTVLTDANTQYECTPADGTPPNDGEDGIDNVLGQLLWRVIVTALDTLSCEIELSHNAGHGTMLIRVDDWNGESDDAQVTVSIAPAVDGTSYPGDLGDLTWNGFSLEVDGADAPPPAWLRTDSFFLNPRAFNGSNEADLRDVNAYVVNDTIVVTLQANAIFELLTDARSVPILMSQGYILAHMDEARENIDRGILAGRYPLDELGEVGNSIGICSEDQDDFNDVYATLGDVLETPRPPGVAPNPNAACTALSMGVGFQATRATWAGLAPMEQPPAIWCDTRPAPPPECD